MQGRIFPSKIIHKPLPLLHPCGAISFFLSSPSSSLVAVFMSLLFNVFFCPFSLAFMPLLQSCFFFHHHTVFFPTCFTYRQVTIRLFSVSSHVEWGTVASIHLSELILCWWRHIHVEWRVVRDKRRQIDPVRVQFVSLESLCKVHSVCAQCYLFPLLFCLWCIILCIPSGDFYFER